MKITVLIGIFCFITLKAITQENTNPSYVLKQVYNKLQSIKRMDYICKRQFHYFSEEYHASDTQNVHLSFTNEDKLVGFYFQSDGHRYKSIYNGTDQFTINYKDSTIDLVNKLERNGLEAISFLYNSPVTLRFAIPMILDDIEIVKTLKDTLLNTKSFYLITLMMKNKSLSSLGEVSKFTIQRNIYYNIIIDKKTFLPVAVKQSNNDNPQDYTLTTFSSYKFKNSPPSEYSWYYHSYTSKFKQKDELQLIATNQIAPLWELPLVNSSGTINLANLKGKIVLLEFGIKNCGPCIQAVPELNTIKDIYKNRAFELIGINAEDPLEGALFFFNKWKVKYTSVYSGMTVAKEYGVSSYPTTILLDKTGKVIYAGDFDRDKLRFLIDNNLSLRE